MHYVRQGVRPISQLLPMQWEEPTANQNKVIGLDTTIAELHTLSYHGNSCRKAALYTMGQLKPPRRLLERTI